MLTLKSQDFLRIQDNDFDIHEQAEDSERLLDTIDLVMERKTIQIAPEISTEKSLIVNELNRVILTKPTVENE